MENFDEALDQMISVNLVLNSNKKLIVRVIEYLTNPIECENVAVLRHEIAEAYELMSPLIRVKSRAEAIYRMAQKEKARGANMKGTGREAEINGGTCTERYARDVLEGYFETLKSRLSAAKAILSSLDNELRNTGE